MTRSAAVVHPLHYQPIANKEVSILEKLQKNGWGIPDIIFIGGGLGLFLIAFAIAVSLHHQDAQPKDYETFVEMLGISICLVMIGLIISIVRLVRNQDDHDS